jgi:hypothetical protein
MTGAIRRLIGDLLTIGGVVVVGTVISIGTLLVIAFVVVTILEPGEDLGLRD